MKKFKLKGYTVKYKETETNSNYNVSIHLEKDNQLIAGTTGKSQDKNYVSNVANMLIASYENQQPLEI